MIFVNEVEDREKYNDKYWIKASAPGFNKMFSFWTERQIKIALNNLIDKQHVAKQKLSKDRFDNTNYYTITEIGLQYYRNEHYVAPISPIDSTENVRSIVRKRPTSPTIDLIEDYNQSTFPNAEKRPIDSTKTSDDRHIDLAGFFDKQEKKIDQNSSNLTYISNISYNRDNDYSNRDTISIKEKEIKKEKEKNLESLNSKSLLKENEKNQEKEKIQKIFAFWQEVMGTKKAILDSKRFNAIKRALLAYPTEELKKAILGCKESDYHMGIPPLSKTGIKYNDIELIVRDSIKIDSFMQIYELKQGNNKQNKPTSGKTLREVFPGRDL
jgi:hypothetical protein